MGRLLWRHTSSCASTRVPSSAMLTDPSVRQCPGSYGVSCNGFPGQGHREAGNLRCIWEQTKILSARYQRSARYEIKHQLRTKSMTVPLGQGYRTPRGAVSCEHGATTGWPIAGESGSTWRNPAPMPLRPSPVSPEVSSDITRTFDRLSWALLGYESGYHRFGRTCCPTLWYFSLKMEVMGFFETLILVTNYKTTWRYKSQGHNTNCNRHGNRKQHLLGYVYVRQTC
jgi:hypothetical protein